MWRGEAAAVRHREAAAQLRHHEVQILRPAGERAPVQRAEGAALLHQDQAASGQEEVTRLQVSGDWVVWKHQGRFESGPSNKFWLIRPCSSGKNCVIFSLLSFFTLHSYTYPEVLIVTSLSKYIGIRQNIQIWNIQQQRCWNFSVCTYCNANWKILEISKHLSTRTEQQTRKFENH